MIKAGKLRERNKKGVFVHVPAYPDKYAYMGMIKTGIMHTHTGVCGKVVITTHFPYKFRILMSLKY